MEIEEAIASLTICNARQLSRMQTGRRIRSNEKKETSKPGNGTQPHFRPTPLQEPQHRRRHRPGPRRLARGGRLLQDRPRPPLQPPSCPLLAVRARASDRRARRARALLRVPGGSEHLRPGREAVHVGGGADDRAGAH